MYKIPIKRQRISQNVTKQKQKNLQLKLLKFGFIIQCYKELKEC
jgi:hypothetical protein